MADRYVVIQEWSQTVDNYDHKMGFWFYTDEVSALSCVLKLIGKYHEQNFVDNKVFEKWVEDNSIFNNGDVQYIIDELYYSDSPNPSSIEYQWITDKGSWRLIKVLPYADRIRVGFDGGERNTFIQALKHGEVLEQSDGDDVVVYDPHSQPLDTRCDGEIIDF